ncbi:MAG: N-acetyltransferase [Alphaproteobacteria bacterium]|nr:N-acetyltransferase [Alphaproteobacteria bacterium]MCL2505133.1 N-acetyltransferase [Alphaproteobacteria bacterium]
MTDKIEYKLDEADNSVGAYLDNKKIGELNFTTEYPSILAITRTWTDDEFRGRGIGAELVRYIAEYARKNEKKIISKCSFAVTFFKNNPAFQDLEYKEST